MVTSTMSGSGYKTGSGGTRPLLGPLLCAYSLASTCRVILTAGGGAVGHKDGPKQGATSYHQGKDVWKLWKAGAYGEISLSDGVIEFAEAHEEIKGYDRNIIDGRGMRCPVLTLTIGHNQGTGDVEHGKFYDIYLPPELCASSMAHPATSWTCGASRAMAPRALASL